MVQHEHGHLGGATGAGAHLVWHQLALALMALAAVAALAVALRRRRRLGENSQQGQATRSAPVGLFASPASAVLAGLVAAAAGIHMAVIREHFLEDPVLGWFFTLLTAAQLGYAALIVLRPTRLLLGLGALANVAVVGLWVYTRTIGIPFGIEGGEVEAVGIADVLSAAVELAAAGLALRMLLPDRLPTAPRRLQPAHAGWALMVVSLSGAVAGFH